MTDDEIIAVVQAHKEGKQIQCVGIHEADRDINWRDVAFNSPSWNFEKAIYRVAPRKPREWTVGVTDDKEIVSWYVGGFNEKIRVREVID